MPLGYTEDRLKLLKQTCLWLECSDGTNDQFEDILDLNGRSKGKLCLES